MSLILDALKRAERERGEILSPFADPDPSALGPARRRFRGWKLALLLAMIAGLAGGAWYYKARKPTLRVNLIDKPAQQTVTPATAPAAPPATVKRTEPRPDPFADRLAQTPPAVIPGTEGTASLDELTKPGAGADSVLAPAPAPTKPESTAATENAPAETQNENETEELPPDLPEETPATEPQPPATPKAAPPAAAAKPVPPALTQQVPLRRFREMTPEFRADFPPLTVEVHVYESAPAKRWAMVNGRRYKEGDRMNEGPVLKEIVANGLVLEFRGEKFIYPLTR